MDGLDELDLIAEGCLERVKLRVETLDALFNVAEADTAAAATWATDASWRAHGT